MRWLWLPTSLFLSSFWLVLVSSITIDDQDGDPTSANTIVYSPPGAWILGAIGNCTNCVSPSPDLAYLNTFHGSLFNPDNTKQQFPPTATVTFFGTSVSVICILANSLTNPNGTSSMTFGIDGIQAKSFSYTPTGSPEFQPNQTVFSASNLSLRNHTLSIQNGPAGEGSSLIILDSVIYSTDVDLFTSTTMTSSTATTSPSSSNVSSIQTAKRSNSAAIAGGVLAALAVILLLGMVFLYLRHRRNQHRSNVPLATTIFPVGRMRSVWSVHGVAARPPSTISTRQLYISNQVHRAQEKVRELEELSSLLRTASVSGTDHDVPRIVLNAVEEVLPASGAVGPESMEAKLQRAVEQIEALNSRIQEMERQRRSSWALGRSDDPPPGYTA